MKNQGRTSMLKSRTIIAMIGFSLLIAGACSSSSGGGGGDSGGSSNPSVELTTPPAITVQPVAATVSAGYKVVFSVTATGAAPLTYQWKWNDEAITNATGSSYEITSATTAQKGLYSVTVNNANGVANSMPVELTVSAAPSLKMAKIPPRGYLQMVQRTLASLSAELASAQGVSVTQESGPPVDFQLGADKVLRYLSPPEQYGDTESVLKFTDATRTKVWRLTMPWITHAGVALTRNSEADENGQLSPDDGVVITPSGIRADDGIMRADLAELSYKFTNTKPIKKMKVYLDTSKDPEDITSYFAWDAANTTLSAKPDKLPGLIALVKAANVASISASLTTPHYKEGYSFEHTISYADGTINVAINNPDITPVTTLSGTKLIAYGFNTGFTASATVGTDGKAKFTGLPGDSYEITQVLLDDSGVSPLRGFSVLPTSSATTLFTIIKRPPAATAPNQVGSRTTVLSAADEGPKTALSGDRAPSAAALPENPWVVAPPPPFNIAYFATSYATDKNTNVITPLNYVVPKGTAKLSVYVEVFTQEFPTFTSQKSQFNDLWSFNVQLPGLPAFHESGKVNQSHATAGWILFEKCMDVAAATKEGPAQLTGELVTQNLGDANHPTKVNLSVGLACNTVTVTNFDGVTRTPDQKRIIVPFKSVKSPAKPDGNVAGEYVSLPMLAQLPSSFGIPATLTFEPKEAVPKEIEIFQRTAAGNISLGKNYLSQATLSEPGQLDFSSLRLAPTVLTPVNERIQLMAVLRATLPDVTPVRESKPVPLIIDNKHSNFTPIYLTSELPAHKTVNRYSTQNESGGDSWATAAMANWLFTSGLRYNDVAAANVKQTDKGRSVLSHAGHSDAQQADIRYWDGAGGFTDKLGGANKGQGVADLATAALAEVTNKTEPKPKLTQLLAWVTENRNNLTAYAAKPEVRRIYIGREHILELLVDGDFPGTDTPLLGLTPWGAVPAKIRDEVDHLDHWHVSTYLP
jgi:hypothetical protein